jgi:hypothetical protein
VTPNASGTASGFHLPLEHNSSGVAWSDQGDVGFQQLIRPGTSNPRYVRDTSTPGRAEEYTNRTPRTPSGRLAESPVTTSDHGSDAKQVAVLWAAEGQEVDPDILARPPTSNPWLTRVIDSSASSPERAGNDSGRDHRVSEILWSSGDVEDWRMLARPHAANPVYEAASQDTPTPVEADDTATVSADAGRRISEVLWKAPDEIDGSAPLSSSERSLLKMQKHRIEQLEAEVVFLRQTLAFHGIPVPPSNLAPVCETDAAIASVQSEPLVSPVWANAPPSPVPALGLPQAKLNPSSAAGTLASERSSQPATERAAPQHHPSRPVAADPPSALEPASIPRDTSQELPQRTATGVDESSSDIPQDTSSLQDEDEACFQSGVVEQPSASKGRSSFVDKVRAAPQTVNRPGTAQTRKAEETRQEGRSGNVARPTSAPHHRRPFAPAVDSTAPMTSINSRHHAISTTGLAIDSRDAVSIEYDRMKKPGALFVEKADFHEAYKKRAMEYGVSLSDRSVEALLKPYKAVGPKYLSREEFAILYLKLAQW